VLEIVLDIIILCECGNIELLRRLLMQTLKMVDVWEGLDDRRVETNRCDRAILIVRGLFLFLQILDILRSYIFVCFLKSNGECAL